MIKLGLALSILASIVALSGALTITCNEAYEGQWINRLTRCYHFSNETVDSWFSALEACDNLGGHLLSIESASERDNIKGYINSLGALGHVSWWTSGTNNIRGQNWVHYGTGRVIVYQDFCRGIDDGSVDHCLLMDSECEYSWTIVSCESPNYYYICEKDVTRY
ncbi:hypothetical protein CHUAL_003660 [Chamberlinius hualienensis]